jgi:hypothetical protein
VAGAPTGLTPADQCTLNSAMIRDKVGQKQGQIQSSHWQFNRVQWL